MGRKSKIAIVTGIVVVLLGAVGAYAYDSTQKDKIADGVTIGGVDVGGMNAAEARSAVRHRLLVPLRARSGSPTKAKAGSSRARA